MESGQDARKETNKSPPRSIEKAVSHLVSDGYLRADIEAVLESLASTLPNVSDPYRFLKRALDERKRNGPTDAPGSMSAILAGLTRQAETAEQRRPPIQDRDRKPYAPRAGDRRRDTVTGGRPATPWREFRDAGCERRRLTKTECYIHDMVWRLQRDADKREIPLRTWKIAQKLGVSLGTVKRAIRNLIRWGFLEWLRGGGDSGFPNDVRIGWQETAQDREECLANLRECYHRMREERPHQPRDGGQGKRRKRTPSRPPSRPGTRPGTRPGPTGTLNPPKLLSERGATDSETPPENPTLRLETSDKRLSAQSADGFDWDGIRRLPRVTERVARRKAKKRKGNA